MPPPDTDVGVARVRDLSRWRGQVVAAQAATLAAVVGWPGPGWLRASTLLLATVVLVATVGRYRSRWLFAWAGVLVGYTRRRRSARRGGPVLVVDPVTSLVLDSFTDRAGTRFGLVLDDRSISAVLLVEPPDGAAVGAAETAFVDLARLADVVLSREVPLAEVRVVLRCGPAPTPWIDPRSSVASSYEEVRAGVQAQRAVTVCLRLEPAGSLSAVLARGGGDLGARRALASATARLAATLGATARVTVLGPDEIRACVAAGVAGPPGPVTEHWSSLSGCAEMVHLSYRVTSWGGGDPADLVAALTRVPGLADVLGLVLRRAGDDGLEVRAVVRLVNVAEDVPAVAAAVEEAARRAGATVVRLDGEQAAALATTLPAGGRAWAGAAGRDARVRVERSWLHRVRLALDRGGVVLGRGDGGSPVVLRLFRDRPTAVVAALDIRVAMVLCYRALATGARVSVVSSRPDRWVPLRRLGVDDPAVVAVASPETARFDAPSPRADRPHLVVVDVADRQEALQVPAQPWQTVLTMLPELSASTLPLTRSAAFTLVRRLPRSQALTAVPFLGLEPGSDSPLVGLGDEQVAVVERGRLLVVDLGLTGAESRLVVAVTGAPAGSAADAADPRVRA